MLGKTVFYRLTIIGILIAIISGCAAVHTSVAKRKLDIQTQVSTAIFVDPVPRDMRTVYVDIRSAAMEFDRRAFLSEVHKEFSQHPNGYRIIDNPDEAHYHLSVYIVKLERTNPTAAEQALRRGYGGDIGAGIIVGAEMGRDDGPGGAVGGAILGAIGTTAANAFVQDITYLLVADVQVKERSRTGATVQKDTKIQTQVSESGTSTQRVTEITDQKEYRTRIVTTANKANLELEEAQPVMFNKTAYAISSFF